jgi:hypothetical protein
MGEETFIGDQFFKNVLLKKWRKMAILTQLAYVQTIMQKYIGDFDTNCSYIIMQNKC